jgi:hypothetical protein
MCFFKNASRQCIVAELPSGRSETLLPDLSTVEDLQILESFGQKFLAKNRGLTDALQAGIQEGEHCSCASAKVSSTGAFAVSRR